LNSRASAAPARQNKYNIRTDDKILHPPRTPKAALHQESRSFFLA
jgi:hypothetical protein